MSQNNGSKGKRPSVKGKKRVDANRRRPSNNGMDSSAGENGRRFDSSAPTQAMRLDIADLIAEKRAQEQREAGYASQGADSRLNRKKQPSIASDFFMNDEQIEYEESPNAEYVQIEDSEDVPEKESSKGRKAKKRSEEPDKPKKGRSRKDGRSKKQSKTKKKGRGASSTVEDPAVSEGRSESRKKPAKMDPKKKRTIILVAIFALLIAAVLAVCVGYFTFTANMNNKISLKDDNLGAVLTQPQEENAPYYVFVEVEYQKTSRYYDGPGLIGAVRIDPEKQVASFISVPPNTVVSLSDGEYHPICEAQKLEGDSYMTETVGKLLGVDFAHVIRLDAEGLAHMVDYFGGIKVDVPEVVDDPDAGDVYIKAGSQTLDGAAAVVLTQADNYSDPVTVRAKNQNAVIEALLRHAVKGTESYGKNLDALKNDFRTDLTTTELKKLLSQLDSEKGFKAYSACIPGELDVDTGGKMFYAMKNDLKKMIESADETGDPNYVDESKVDKSSVFIEVRNGAGIEGGALQVRKVLQDDDWRVSFTSNEFEDVYPDTLVVYKDKEMLPAAQAVVETLGVGRTVEAGEYYEFGTDLLVILGKDWKPIS